MIHEKCRGKSILKNCIMGNNNAMFAILSQAVTSALLVYVCLDMSLFEKKNYLE